MKWNSIDVKPKPFQAILGYDDKGEVHEYWYANEKFHEPYTLIATKTKILQWCYMPHPSNLNIDYTLYNQETLYQNCTVQILKNTITGEESIGWWNNETPPFNMEGDYYE